MRRLRIALYLLIALAELLQWAIVPLIPAYAARFSLSEVQSGALLAGTGIATLVTALPAGLLADRLGARRVTLGASAALAAGAVGQALASSYALLLIGRLVLGVGFGILWTTGLAWLSVARAADDSSAAVGGTVTSAGVGTVVAPGFAGLVAQRLGLGAPFLIAGIVAAITTAVLATAPGGETPSAEERTTVATVRAAGRDPGVVAALAAILLAGLAGAMIGLLAPLELHAANFSKASIGLAFSGAAVVFIAASAVTVRLGERAVGVRAIVAGSVACALAISPATASGAAVAVLAVMCLTAPLRGLLYTAGYPLGAARAPRAGVGAGTVMGLLNAAWALAAVVGPLAAGALAQSVGPRASYALLQAFALGAVAAIWLGARRGVGAAVEPATGGAAD